MGGPWPFGGIERGVVAQEQHVDFAGVHALDFGLALQILKERRRLLVGRSRQGMGAYGEAVVGRQHEIARRHVADLVSAQHGGERHNGGRVFGGFALDGIDEERDAHEGS